MEEENAGLPMAVKWDPEKLRLENKHLLELEKKSFPVRIRGYFKLTGPAWLQSAMTLGAGSAAASVIAGASFGYQLLWVQPLAMLLGVFMLAALGNVTLSRGERPYKSFSRELAPWVAFLWALGAIVASVIWHFPQYGLVGGAAWDLAQLVGAEPEAGSAAASVIAGASFGYQLLWVQPLAMLLGVFMLAALGNVTLSRGERPYKSFSQELAPWVAFLWALGAIVASVIWHFPQYGLVGGAAWDLAQLVGAEPEAGGLQYIVKFGVGFIILGFSIMVTWNYGSHSRGIRFYEGFLRWMIRCVIVSFLLVVVYTGVDWGKLLAGFFTFQIPDTDGAIIVILGAFGAAVGINMTFLYPYSMLAKGWGKFHKGLSHYDLFSSMFLPYVITTSLVIIAMAENIYEPGMDAVRTDLRPVEAAAALGTVLGSTLGRIIFDLGLIGMACGAISTHMVVCGFTCCEMFKMEYTSKRYRLFTLVPAIGILGVAFRYPLWMPVAASAVCLTLLPLAYIAFFIMNNKKSYLGKDTGSGIKRILLNAILLLAILAATLGSAVLIKTRVIDVIF